MGFGVLVLSDIRMLRDFGLVTLIDLSVALAGVLVALPAALVLFGGPAERPARGRGAARRARREPAAAVDGGPPEEALAQPLAMASPAASSFARDARAREGEDSARP